MTMGIISGVSSIGLGLFGAYSSAQASRDALRQQQRALEASRTQLDPFAFYGPGGMSAQYQPGQYMQNPDGTWTDTGGGGMNVNAGELEGVRQNLSQYATASTPRAGAPMDPRVAQAMQAFRGVSANMPNMMDQNLGSNEYRAQSMVDPFQQQMQQAMGGFDPFGVQSTAYRGAAGQLQAAGQGFPDVYQGVLGNLRQQAQPFEQRAWDTMVNDQFGRGQMGASNTGGMQTEAFARGLGQADLSRQLSALGEARTTQQNALGIGQGLAGVGGQMTGIQDQLLGSAFGRFGQSLGLAQDLNQQRFTRGLLGNQMAYDRTGALLGQEQNYAQLPMQYDALRLGNVAAALQGQSGINSQALQNFQMGLAANQAAANARIGAGSNMAAIVGSPSYGALNQAGPNAITQVAGQLAPAGGGWQAIQQGWANRPAWMGGPGAPVQGYTPAPGMGIMPLAPGQGG